MEGIRGDGASSASPLSQWGHDGWRIYQYYLDKTTPHTAYRYSMTKAFCIAFVMTFFSLFDVPVFWPILLCYWIVLFVLTMRRQIAHMIKYEYIPLNIGKQKYTGKKASTSGSSLCVD